MESKTPCCRICKLRMIFNHEKGKYHCPVCKAQPKDSPKDMVNHPAHYKVNGLECIDVIEGLGLGYHLGNAFKYIWRAGRKHDAKEDLKKAIWYIERHIEKMP